MRPVTRHAGKYIHIFTEADFRKPELNPDWDGLDPVTRYLYWWNHIGAVQEPGSTWRCIANEDWTVSETGRDLPQDSNQSDYWAVRILVISESKDQGTLGCSWENANTITVEYALINPWISRNLGTFEIDGELVVIDEEDVDFNSIFRRTVLHEIGHFLFWVYTLLQLKHAVFVDFSADDFVVRSGVNLDGLLK